MAAVAAAPHAAGGHVVQVGAFRSRAVALRTWAELTKRHPRLLGAAPHVLVPSDLGARKGVYYRLQVGPYARRAAAEALCRRLKAASEACFVTRAAAPKAAPRPARKFAPMTAPKIAPKTAPRPAARPAPKPAPKPAPRAAPITAPVVPPAAPAPLAPVRSTLGLPGIKD